MVARAAFFVPSEICMLGFLFGAWKERTDAMPLLQLDCWLKFSVIIDHTVWLVTSLVDVNDPGFF